VPLSAAALLAISVALQLAPSVVSPWAALAWLAPALVARRWRIPLLLLALQTLNLALDGRDWQQRRLDPVCERRLLTFEGVVRGLGETLELSGRSVQRVQLDIRRLEPADCAGPRRLRLYLEHPRRLLPGDRLRGSARLRLPWGSSNPGDRGAAQYRYFSAAIHALGSAAEVEVLKQSAPALPYRVDRLRHRLSAQVRASVSGAPGALLPALLLGDRRAMTDTHWERLREFGLTHLLVISGMHVSLLAAVGAGAALLLLRLLAAAGAGPGRRALAPVLALAAAAAYTVLSGAGLPAFRALLMLTPALLLLAAGRGAGGWHYWSLAVIAVLLLQPRAVLGASFWLSFTAVGLLLWLAAFRRRASPLRDLVVTQAFMTLAMLPMGFFWFGGAGVLGGLANLLAVPLVTLWVVPVGMAGIAAGVLSQHLAEFCWALAAGPLEWLWRALEAAHARYEGWLYFSRAGLPLAGFLILISAGLMLAIPARRIRVLALVSVLALARSPAPERAQTELVVFDVGQGTAVLARVGTRAVLYDTGPALPGQGSRAESVILPYLRRVGVRSLELLVVSHLDSDHSGGSAAILSALPVKRRWAGPGGVDGFERCRPGRRLELPGLEIVALSSARAADSDNNQSCVLRLDMQGLRVLLPGDIDRGVERELAAYWSDRLRADVLLAAHHGSASSSSRLFLRQVRPRHVVATSGRGNRFGHPAAAVRNAVADQGALLWSSAEHGALRLARDGSGRWRLSPSRHAGQPYWRRDGDDGALRLTFNPPGVILRAQEEE
jgi:competence protein ComEC